MIVLDKDLKMTNWFQPESMALNLEERKSTATIVTGPEVPDIAVGTLLRDDTEPGEGIVWRVKSRNIQYERQTKTYTLEHIINTLRDDILFGEVSAATITGNKKATTCTAYQAANYALGRQSLWKLGDFDYSVSNPYSFNGDTIFAALETISNSLEDCCWEYDLSKFPFRLHIRKIPAEIQSEMRMDRNIQSLKVNIDRSQMYTRFYPIGNDDLHISGEYVSKNEDLYGTVCHVETNQEKKTEDALRSWAREKLSRHAEPSVTVTISGLDLSRATGESLDKFTLNTKCRVPLPDYGTVITEKVTKLSWSDKINEPDKVTVTLANTLMDVASIINRLASSSASGGRRSAKKAGEDHAWIEDTEEHVYLVAEAIIGQDPNGVNWSRVSKLGVDGTGIHGSVVKAQGDIIAAQTRIDATEDAITLEASRRIAKDQELQGKITVEAGKVGMVVGTKNGENFIKAGEICVAINADGSSTATIEATKIHLLGQTIASYITAARIKSVIAQIAQVNAQTIQATSLKFSYTGSADGPFMSCRELIEGYKIVKSGNNYKLQYKRYNSTSWNDAPNSETFSRAVSSFTQGWANGRFTVKANPQDQSCYTDIVQGTASWSGKKVTIPIEAIDSNNPNIQYATGRSVTATYNGSVISDIAEAYTTAPNGASYDGNTNNSDGYFISGSGRGKTVGIVVKAELKNSGGTVLATLYNDLIAAPTNIYKKGWDSAAGVIEIPPTISGSTTKSYFDFTYPTTSGSSTIRFNLSKDSGGAYLKIGTALKLRVS